GVQWWGWLVGVVGWGSGAGWPGVAGWWRRQHFPDHVLLFNIFYFSEAWDRGLADLLGTILPWARPPLESSSRPDISPARTLRYFGTIRCHSGLTLKSKTWSGGRAAPARTSRSAPRPLASPALSLLLVRHGRG